MDAWYIAYLGTAGGHCQDTITPPLEVTARKVDHVDV